MLLCEAGKKECCGSGVVAATPEEAFLLCKELACRDASEVVEVPEQGWDWIAECDDALDVDGGRAGKFAGGSVGVFGGTEIDDGGVLPGAVE